MGKFFPILQPILTILFIFIACIVYGLSLFLSFVFFNYMAEQSELLNINLRFLIYGISLGEPLSILLPKAAPNTKIYNAVEIKPGITVCLYKAKKR